MATGCWTEVQRSSVDIRKVVNGYIVMHQDETYVFVDFESMSAFLKEKFEGK